MARRSPSSHIRTDLKYLNRDFSPNITAVTVDDDIFRWEATLIGPVNTPYEGGVFKLRLSFPPDYPRSPPKFVFITRICHPNVSDSGGIYLKVLRTDCWIFMPIVKLFKGLVEKLIEPEVNDEQQTIEYLPTSTNLIGEGLKPWLER
ncbi:PREDICTED: ubiquitin-conjugating enzyme E2 2-like [Camelina sativa]|uniref:Ubiquitin-conjugating enzyme E2 2-like n=1 Tax=Camelina sativa TaxID=90675 RepID=A0ABM0TT34_CAMSA|nr:PREDICTED: ubiquitin-conjugating enzyme E2 2-like [Camelina sativa]